MSDVEGGEVQEADVCCDVPEESAAPAASAKSPAKPCGPLEEMLEACPAPRLPIDTEASGQAQGEGLRLELEVLGSDPATHEGRIEKLELVGMQSRRNEYTAS